MTVDETSVKAFNPLETPLDEETILRTNQGLVASICQSYHGRMDSFAEAVQNAVDAIQKRWSDWAGPGTVPQDGHLNERPQLRVIVDCASNLVDVIDNGTGMDDYVLKKALRPSVSLKYDEEHARGHKGVGLTYLTYGHNLFAIESKTPAGINSYELRYGLDWTKQDPPAGFPVFKPVPPLGYLEQYGRGTAVRMLFGIGTNYGNLSATYFNRPELWDYQLRSYTAIGLISLGLTPTSPSPWIEHLEISVDLRNTLGAAVRTPHFDFPYPHNYLPEQDVVELELLRHKPDTNNKYKLIYMSRSHEQLRQLLQPEFEKLKEESESAPPDSIEAQLYSEVITQFDKGEIAAYASLAYTNRLYDQIFKNAIKQDTAQRLPPKNIQGGVLIASQRMVIGEVLGHRETYRTLRPEERSRFFLLLHFNRTYRPDIGRKTIPKDKEQTVGWLETAIIRTLTNHSKHLQQTNDDATQNAAGYGQAQQVLSHQTDEILRKNSTAEELALSGLVIARPARTEAEVVAQFICLLALDYLPGYKIEALPGNQSRYDALFSVNLSTPAEESYGLLAQLGVSSSNFSNGAFLRTRKWLEFKLELLSAIDEFSLGEGLPNKKYFEQVDLIVCWIANLPSGTAEYELVPLTGSASHQRNYPGSTHKLTKFGAAHAIEVICVSQLIETIKTISMG